MFRHYTSSFVDATLVPGAMASAFEYIPLETHLSGRLAPTYLTVPFRLKDAVGVNDSKTTSMLFSIADARSCSLRL